LKRFVNGEDVELDEGAASVRPASDRLMVKTPQGTFSAVAIRQGDKVLISYKGRQFTVEKARPRTRAGAGAGSGELRAPMPGQIVDVLSAEGESVSKGDKVLVLEAMKTQQAFVAPFDGVVTKVLVSKGQQVAEGDIMAVVEEPKTASE
jgi:3-methylcrotonyl-CoA carboxylase alpha subunit